MAAVGAAAGIYLFMRESDESALTVAGEPMAPAPGENAASEFEGGPPELLVLSGTSLVRQDIEEQSEDILDELPAPSVYAASGSHWLAYVVSEKPEEAGEEDFVAEPRLHIYDPREGSDEDFGPGVSPLWNAFGNTLAYLRPVEPLDCAGESCPGEVEVVLAFPGEETKETLLGEGRYTLLGWAGDRLLVADQSDPDKILSVDMEGSSLELDVAADEFWDASPDGKWLVKVAETTQFIPLEDGLVSGDPIDIPLDGEILAEGGFSPDSSRVAAVILDEGRGVDEVGVFSPEKPEPVPVDESVGATGRPFWSPDSSALLITTVTPEGDFLQASYCPIDVEGSCKLAKTWSEGVTLLRLE